MEDMRVYEWLAKEMAEVRSRAFFHVDGRASPVLRDEIARCKPLLPPSYKNFLLKFGNAKLYRQGGTYLVQVFAQPEQIESEAGEGLLHFGRTDLSLAYFKIASLRGGEAPVFEWLNGRSLRETSGSFDQWLRAKCADARSQFKKEEWEAIVRGPPPFSEREVEIVEARRRFRWRIVGVTPNGNIQFEIYNGSNIVLPYLSVGVRGKRRSPLGGLLSGGLWLPTSSIYPGECRIIEKDCYKDLADPNDIEVFEKPDPEPEERDRYWEFRQE